MKKIIFVDDEKSVLDGLRRSLRSQRKVWDMAFAMGGEIAKQQIESKGDFDVVVTDMRMPGIDGAQLLTWVKQNHPEIVRIVLSGYSEVEAAIRTVAVAHQFLCKPCEPTQLKSVIERTCELQELLQNETLRSIVSDIDQLPTLPKIYTTLVSRLSDLNASIKDVAQVVEQDVGLCAKLLQLVNSAFFGLPKRMNSIQPAITYLGTNMIKHLVLSLEVFSANKNTVSYPGFSIDELQRHCFLAGNIARNLLKDKRQSEDAFMAGILHDIGRLVIANGMPDSFKDILTRYQEGEDSLYKIETDLLGVSHAEIGAYLLGIWGLPYAIVEAVAHHHNPMRLSEPKLDVASIVHIASQLAYWAEEKATEEPVFDGELIETLNISEQLPEWKKMAMEKMDTLPNLN